MLGGLGEAQPRVEDDLVSATPAACAAASRSRSSSATSRTTSSYTARDCMSALCPRQCISTTAQPASATSGSIAGSACPPDTSLTIAAPGGERGLGDLRPGGVHRHDRAGRGELAHDGHDPAQLLRGLDPGGAGPGGLAADVEQVRAGGPQRQPVLDGVGRGGRRR